MPKAIIPGKETSKVKKKVLEIDYMEMNRCCTKMAKVSPNFSFSWFSAATVSDSTTGSKKIVFQCFGDETIQQKHQFIKRLALISSHKECTLEPCEENKKYTDWSLDKP